MMWTDDPVRDQMRYEWEQEYLREKEAQEEEWEDDHDDSVQYYR